jgi:hypothetical protein
MSELLRKAFEKLQSELREDEQDELGRYLLQLVESDERAWMAQFKASEDTLANLADRWLAEYQKGETELLDRKRF